MVVWAYGSLLPLPSPSQPFSVVSSLGARCSRWSWVATANPATAVDQTPESAVGRSPISAWTLTTATVGRKLPSSAAASSTSSPLLACKVESRKEMLGWRARFYCLEAGIIWLPPCLEPERKEGEALQSHFLPKCWLSGINDASSVDSELFWCPGCVLRPSLPPAELEEGFWVSLADCRIIQIQSSFYVVLNGRSFLHFFPCSMGTPGRICKHSLFITEIYRLYFYPAFIILINNLRQRT